MAQTYQVDDLADVVRAQQETLDALTHYVEDLKVSLEARWEAAVRQQRKTVDGLERAVDELREAVGASSPTPVTAGSGPVAGGPTPAPAPTATLDRWGTDPGDGPVDWVALVAFVDAFVQRYQLFEQVRPCWARHGEDVDELSALWRAWQLAYGPDVDPSMPSWWQDLAERVRFRLARAYATCGDGHREAERRDWMTDHRPEGPTPAAGDPFPAPGQEA
ncbi:hypothetical protein [Micromonospora sp. KC723]|uniref:hypothetical protein n=1 Tax=Micromonospora sp. KC723 TaxID=2530381 RepID=UPI00104F7B67|nr:hypothetical protein [Micromonospora sp. KC723]TDB77971.1 hypothetical protein E1165_02365 [Micromonospora sp. KC723]